VIIALDCTVARDCATFFGMFKTKHKPAPKDSYCPSWDGSCPYCGRFLPAELEAAYRDRCDKFGDPVGVHYVENTAAFHALCPGCENEIGVAVDASLTESHYILFGPMRIKADQRKILSKAKVKK